MSSMISNSATTAAASKPSLPLPLFPEVVEQSPSLVEYPSSLEELEGFQIDANDKALRGDEWIEGRNGLLEFSDSSVSEEIFAEE